MLSAAFFMMQFEMIGTLTSLAVITGLRFPLKRLKDSDTRRGRAFYATVQVCFYLLSAFFVYCIYQISVAGYIWVAIACIPIAKFPNAVFRVIAYPFRLIRKA